jgi:hypothetical protein
MPNIVFGKECRAYPAYNTLEVQDRDINPVALGHEIGHFKTDYGCSISPLSELVEERDAWAETSRKLPPDEVDLDFINSSVGSYVKEIREAYGEDSLQFEEAKKIRRQVMGFARKRKYGVD